MHPKFVRLSFPQHVILFVALIGGQNLGAQPQGNQPQGSQPLQPVQWSATASPNKVAPGQTTRVTVTATIEPGWHLYSVTSPVTATATKFAIPDGIPLILGAVYQKPVTAKFDQVAQASTESYEKETTFVADVAVAPDAKAGTVFNLQVRAAPATTDFAYPRKND